MRGLTADELLDLWERGRRASAIDRTLVMLAATGAVDSPDAVTLGDRDRALLELRAATFGDQLEAVAACPSCGERCAFTLACARLLLPGRAERSGGTSRSSHPNQPNHPSHPTHAIIATNWRHGTWTAQVRMPTVADLAAVATCATEEEAESALLGRCIDDLRDGDDPATADPTQACAVSTDRGGVVALAPPEVRDALAAALAALDPQADLTLDLRCAACDRPWRTRLDLATFLWNEIATAAQHILEQVHLLAATYGWRERDILSLTTERRDAYVRLCAGAWT